MKNTLFTILLLFSVCISSSGQVRVYDGSGEALYAFGGIANIADELIIYRDLYGHYPDDKKTLVDFIRDNARYKGTDRSFKDQVAARKRMLTRLVKNRENEYFVSRDTCLFHIAETGVTIQCSGGVAELQKYDSFMFRHWTVSRFFDKNGHILLPSISNESPLIPGEIRNRFNRIVTTEKKGGDTMAQKGSTTPVLIPVTMKRNGRLSYDVSCLEGLQLYCQELGKPLNHDNTPGSISIEEAIDPDYLYAMEVYLNDFLRVHKDIDSMRLWELVVFNEPHSTNQEFHHTEAD